MIAAIRKALGRKDVLRLSDGTVAKVGLRVLVDIELYRKWGFDVTGGHLFEPGVVHEITGLMSIMICLGPSQSSGNALRRAPRGAKTTCRACGGWHEWRRKSAEEDAARVVRRRVGGVTPGTKEQLLCLGCGRMEIGHAGSDCAAFVPSDSFSCSWDDCAATRTHDIYCARHAGRALRKEWDGR